MADRPIIFSAPMVRALLAGRKTQTRRLLRGAMPAAPAINEFRLEPRHDAPYLDAYCGGARSALNPRGMGPTWCWWTRDDRPGPQFQVGYVPGDRLWVREGLHLWPGHAEYAADDAFVQAFGTEARAWLDGYARASAPSIHMPRWASRLTLIVSDVRVQRLQDITNDDCIAEGVPVHCNEFAPRVGPIMDEFARQNGLISHYGFEFRKIWASLHGADAWSANPWVVALTFTVEQGNIDALREAA